MRRGPYTGGSSLIGRGGHWSTYDPAAPEPARKRPTSSDDMDRHAPKRTDAETAQIMEEHDRLRAQGVDPVAGLSKEQKRRKAPRSKPPKPGCSATGLTAAEERRRAAEKIKRLETAVAAAQKELAKLQSALARACIEQTKLRAGADRASAPSVSRVSLQDLADELLKGR